MDQRQNWLKKMVSLAISCKQFMKTLLATLFVLLNTSSIAQELPDSVLNIKWNVDQITTSEHSISLDTIIEWMMGKDLTVSIEQKTTKCVTDSLEMKYILRTSVCNSCSYQFNVKGNKVSGCVCWCQMVLCTDGKGKLEWTRETRRNSHASTV
jgi:hypothetical protein